jgi:hypothetical protein
MEGVKGRHGRGVGIGSYRWAAVLPGGVSNILLEVDACVGGHCGAGRVWLSRDG